MLNSIVYVVAFAAALSVAAMCVEHLAVSRRQPRRLAWALAMLCSALLPPLMMLKADSDQSAAPVTVALIQPVAIADVANPLTAPEISPAFSAATASESSASNPTMAWQVPLPSRSSLLTTWAVISGAMLAFLAGTGLLLWRRSAGWQRMVIQGHEVLVSVDTGPALLGAQRPRIVVPRWFMDEPVDTQLLILEHEQQHIAARDPLLLRVAMLVAIAAPWNLPLWWQLRRLRLAIELDCDTRVMRGGANAGHYGEVLLGVTQRATSLPIGVITMSEPVSALETRIRSLAPVPGRHPILRGIGAVLIAMAGVGAAAALDAPAIQPAPIEPALRAAAPAAPTSRAMQAPGTTPVTPIKPATLAAAPTAPPRPPQPLTENPAGAVAKPAPPTPPRGTPPTGNAMDMRELIAVAGKKFQKHFVVNPVVQGTVDLGSLTTESLTYHAFLEILGVHGFVAMPYGDVVTILPEYFARRHVSPIVPADNIQGDDSEIVTVLISLASYHPTGREEAKASDVAGTMESLLSTAGHISPMPDGNSLLVIDRVSNVKRIVTLVKSLSKPQ